MQNVSRIQRLRCSVILLTAALTFLVVNLGQAGATPADISNIGPGAQRGIGERSAAAQSEDGPACLTSGPKGIWGQYTAHDLPRGHCSGADACILWTKDSCPRTDFPGPAIKWKCVCASGTWRCGEQERSKAICP